MDKEKSEKMKNPQGMSDTDKEYYEDLYQDLPKEVVDILMETHPLMGKNNEDKEATAYRTRRPQRGDVEEIREARMQQIGSELSEMRRAPQQEGEPTKYVSRRARNTEPEAESVHTQKPKAHTMEDEEREIQYVSMMPARKKSHITEEVTMQSISYKKPQKKKRRQREEDMPFSDTYAGARPRYEDMDFAERAKQENLDELYDDYDDYDEGYRGKRSKIPLIAGIIGVVIIVALLFKCINLNSELQDAKRAVQQTEELNEKYEQIQIEKMQLQEEVDKLKDPDGSKKAAEEKKKAEEADKKKDKKDSEEKKDTKDKKESSAAGTKEHTVQENETPWTIAAKYYGNGAEYNKILEANGLKEGDNIRPGTKLKIPAA